ncbi:HMG-Y-related protein B [Hibiscus syriacus]|uniref:HMG-Y-related protein B n=1 Tax=Hibiscus syriacus TaxID=106335 RepID=A0A6A2ZYT5_HIBSY|nr:HMG-Y-related protein B-like [Hibiscus syriacus]KAE8696055.1 HMG-Y-related protein B [Hibiscus syriacus]
MKADPNAPPRCGRGRPPKPKVPLPPGMVLSSGWPRGRPPKDPNAPPRSPKPSGSGKPRGRPRKMARPEGEIGGCSTTMTSTSAVRRRPPKVKASTLNENLQGICYCENCASEFEVFL